MTEFLRYLISSALALGADFGLYSGAIHLGMPYQAAACIGFALGLCVAYFLSVRWAFNVRTLRDTRSEFLIFAGVGVAGLLLTESILWVEIYEFHMNALWAKIGAAGCVFLFNFSVRKAMLFSRSTRLSRSLA